MFIYEKNSLYYYVCAPPLFCSFYRETAFNNLTKIKMFSHAQKLMVSDIITLSMKNGFDFACHTKEWFLQIILQKSWHAIYYDESKEESYHPTKRYYFFKKIIRDIIDLQLKW